MNYVENASKHEGEIIRFFRKLGFKDVDGGNKLKVGGHQVDACAGHEKTLLILECTTDKEIKKKIIEFRGKISNIISGFQNHEIYKSYDNYCPILAVKYQKVSRKEKKYAEESEGRKIYIWDNKFVKYYSDLSGTIKKYAKYNLLSELEIKPEVTEKISIPSFSMDVGPQGRNKLFLFFIEAKELLKYAYVARRELGQESYYQRMVKKSRLIEIAKNYIKKNKIFSNSIVVALDSESLKWTPKKTEKLEIPKWLELGELTLTNNFRSCWIIDGQHRLYSYAHSTHTGYIAVSAFAKISPEMQANYFLDINKEAKTVSPDLLWDLTGSISETSSKGIISNTVKDLYDTQCGFFENNIKIPSKGSGYFSMNGICSSLEERKFSKEELSPGSYKSVKNPFFDQDYKIFKSNLSKSLNEYFNIFKEGLGNEKYSKLYTNGFISVFIEIFWLIIGYLARKPKKEDLNKIFNPLWQYYSLFDKDSISKQNEKLTSKAGKKSLRNEIIRKIQQGYQDDFADGLIDKEETLIEKVKNLEFRFNKFVNKILEKNIGLEWYKDANNLSIGSDLKRCKKEAEFYNKPFWWYINFTTTINSIIFKENLWNKCFEDIFISPDYFRDKEEIKIYANNLWSYRSRLDAHQGGEPIVLPIDRERLIETQYNMFDSILKKENI